MTTDLQDTLWAVTSTEGAKWHYCPKQLINDLIVDLELRFGPSEIVEGIDKGCIDLPGMIMTNRPWRDIKIDTFTLSIPSQDFSYFLGKMERAQVRTFSSGKKYYKLHANYHCVVFTPEQYYLVLEAMREMKESVLIEAEVADRKFSAGIAEMNQKAEKSGGAMVLSARDKYSEYSPIVELVAPKKDCN